MIKRAYRNKPLTAKDKNSQIQLKVQLNFVVFMIFGVYPPSHEIPDGVPRAAMATIRDFITWRRA